MEKLARAFALAVLLLVLSAGVPSFTPVSVPGLLVTISLPNQISIAPACKNVLGAVTPHAGYPILFIMRNYDDIY